MKTQSEFSKSMPGVPIPVRPSDTKETPPAVPVLKSALTALPFTALFSVVLLVLATFIVYNRPDPDAWMPYCAVGTTALSALFGGILTVRLHKGNALLSGLCGGILFTGLCMLLSLLFVGQEYVSGYSSGVSFLLHFGIFSCEILGAFLGLPRKTVSSPKQFPHRKTPTYR